VAALVAVQVNTGDSDRGSLDERLLNRRRFPCQAYDQPVVIYIRPIIEKGASLPFAKGSHNGLDNFGPSPLAEIGDAFDQVIHEYPSFRHTL
jgi:hypothetical protein